MEIVIVMDIVMVIAIVMVTVIDRSGLRVRQAAGSWKQAGVRRGDRNLVSRSDDNNMLYYDIR